MTKQTLINYIAEQTGLTKVDSAKALDAAMEGIVEGLKKEGKVVITGFCAFTTTEKAARKARNPRTGETIEVPAKTSVKIKAGTKLKDALN